MSRVDPTQRTSRQASAPRGAEPALPVEVLDPSDPRGRDIRYANGEKADPNYNRQTAQDFSRTSNTTNQAQTNSAQDFNENSREKAHKNINGQVRTFVDKIGTTLMWSAGGLAGLLYLGLGWKRIAMVIGGLGVGVGYLLKTKLAKVGEEADHHQQVVNAIKAMKLPKELEREIFEFLNQRLSAAQNFAQGQALKFNNQPA